jgi:isopentenyl diphosphate isomerase/L-lactate dehydrogenase-like FMN-dependent dehydrogenase
MPSRLSVHLFLMLFHSTTILGYHVALPIFISPAAAPGAVGGYVPKNRELGLLKGAANHSILYIPAHYAEMSLAEFAKAASPDQLLFQQLYADPTNMTFNQEFLSGVEAADVAKAIVWTINAPTDGNRIRSEWYTLQASTDAKVFTWDFYDKLKAMTKTAYHTQRCAWRS